MAIVVNMPRLSDTMEEGTVAAWLKKVGDKIEEGDILAEIETDKATMEFESFNEGTLLYIGVQEGQTVKVDELLAIIGDEGEDISALLNGSKNDVSTETKQEEQPKAKSKEEAVSQPEAAASIPAELPEGVVVVTMPRLSDTMEEGTVATWLKKVGDTVKEGDILAEIETDKATMEFESFNEGTLLYIGVHEGESAKVDSLLAIIGPAGTDVSGIVANYKSTATSTKIVEASKPEASNQAPKATATASTPVKSSKPAPTPVNENGRVFVSPLAKKLAEEKGINLLKVQGSGENGRIVKRDIEHYEPASGAASVGKFVPSGQEDFEDVENSQMRKAIAKALTNSKFTAPHYYLSVEFDMENAIAFRTQFNSIPDTKISYNDIVLKACALALKQHPQVNSQWFPDKMRLNHHVHIGVAVAVPDGLVVPVVKFANELTLPQIGATVKELAGKARNKKLTPDEMQGSTFTVSNLGMFGIDTFTSIINQPNSAILSVGNIVDKPVVKNGQIVVGHTMKLSLACDHRTVDGATGAQFLQTLKNYIENPVTMIV
jgi:pyruvate dehydrogenase E2 component (dihydrolipoamide acetyltransferase)